VKKHPRRAVVLCTPITFLTILLSTSGWAYHADAAQRVVLQEYFTEIGCTYCPNGGHAVEQILDLYPAQVAVIEYHYNDAYANPWSIARHTAFYSIWGRPTAYIDGTALCLGAATIQRAFDCYNGKILDRLATPTNVTLDLVVTPLPEGEPNYHIAETAGLEPPAPQQIVRLYVAELLDFFPANPSYSRNTFRRAGTPQDVILQPGDCATVTWDLLVDPTDPNDLINLPNLKIVAWAQAPLNVAPAEVYQAVQAKWPFAPPVCRGDANCDTFIDWRDIDYFVAGMNDGEQAWVGLFPNNDPPCPFWNLDANLDGHVNWRDIDPFITALNTNCTTHELEPPPHDDSHVSPR